MTQERRRAVIVDDEPLARRALSLLVGRDKEVEIVGECGDGESAIRTVRAQAPDLLFLDVQMPGRDGFEVLAAIGADAVPAVIFVTAFDHYALRAFEAHALDYLLKPFSDERFHDVLARVKRHLRDRSAADLERRLADLLSARTAPPRQLVIRDGGRTVIVPWSDIDWIEAEDYCVRIHAGKQRPLVRRSLRSLMDELDPASFARIHRSAIVNLARVREVRPLPSGDHEVLLVNGTSLRMSRNFKDAFDAQLGV